MRRGLLRAACAALALAPADPARAFEPEGTWYVLVHFQDAGSGKPDAWRWEDRVWRFEPRGDRLEWTEWPIVVFEDESGRFENLGGNRASRVLTAWEPSPSQRADIESGLQVNPRGVKTKTLRADGGGWRSGERAAAEAASIITYAEHWSIEGLPDRPVFRREDSLGSATSETMEGRIEYRTEEVGPDGTLRGSFDRDGVRIGRFEMMPSGGTEKVRGSGLTQGQRVIQMFSSQAGLKLDAEQIRALQAARVAPGTPVPDDLRRDLRAEIRRSVEESIREQGGDPRVLSAQVDGLVREIERQIVDEGRSVEEVRRMLETGEITP
jgi:hypothetical protein